jgi:hypothetical protein
MTRKLLALAVLMLIGSSVWAHRLDEYLQGTILSVTRDRLSADLTLTPGVAIFPVLIPAIDTNADGKVSDFEQHAYAERVLGDLSLSLDGHPLTPRLISAEFPSVAEMKEGRGEIRIEFDAALAPGGAHRKLLFDNRHQGAISVYQVNVLVPRDRDIRIVSQNRNYTQSHYELDFDQAGAAGNQPASAILGGIPGQFAAIALLAFTVLVSIRLLRQRRAEPSLANHRLGTMQVSPSTK